MVAMGTVPFLFLTDDGTADHRSHHFSARAQRHFGAPQRYKLALVLGIHSYLSSYQVS